MKKILSAIAVLILACIPVFAADFNGTWTAEVETPMGTQHYTYVFHVDGAKLTGTAKNELGETELKEGKVDGDAISFVETIEINGNSLRIVYTGKMDGEQIKFTRQVGDFATESLVAKRAK